MVCLTFAVLTATPSTLFLGIRSNALVKRTSVLYRGIGISYLIKSIFKKWSVPVSFIYLLVYLHASYPYMFKIFWLTLTSPAVKPITKFNMKSTISEAHERWKKTKKKPKKIKTKQTKQTKKLALFKQTWEKHLSDSTVPSLFTSSNPICADSSLLVFSDRKSLREWIVSNRFLYIVLSGFALAGGFN